MVGFDLEGLGRGAVALQWAYLQSVAEFNL